MLNNKISIEVRSGWQIINFHEIIEYKDLFYFLILKDIITLYKQSVLGFAWAIIRPVFSMIVFTVIFGGLANIPSDGIPYPIFSYTALIPWTYFSTALTTSTQSMIAGASIFSKVYFPRLLIPLTPIFSKLVDFFIAFIILFGLMAWYNIMPTINILWIPLLIILMMMSASGIGMLLSALAIQYRDIPHGIQFLSQLMMYAAPVVWPISLITEKYGETTKLLYALYPMVGIIEGFRAALLGQKAMPWDLIGMGTLTSVILFLVGALYFKRKERFFADVA